MSTRSAKKKGTTKFMTEQKAKARRSSRTRAPAAVLDASDARRERKRTKNRAKRQQRRAERKARRTHRISEEEDYYTAEEEFDDDFWKAVGWAGDPSDSSGSDPEDLLKSSIRSVISQLKKPSPFAFLPKWP